MENNEIKFELKDNVALYFSDSEVGVVKKIIAMSNEALLNGNMMLARMFNHLLECVFDENHYKEIDCKEITSIIYQCCFSEETKEEFNDIVYRVFPREIKNTLMK